MSPGRWRRSPAWWWAALQASMATPFVAVAIRTLGVRQVLRRVGTTRGGGSSVGRGPTDASQRVAEVASAIRAVTSRRPYRVGCLTRSVVLLLILRRRGLPAELVIGLGGPGRPVLPGHAWVEHCGVPVIDRPDIAQLYPPIAASGDLTDLRPRDLEGVPTGPSPDAG